MPLARVKTWVAGDSLTAADLNAEFNNILNNALSLVNGIGTPSFTGLTLTGLTANSFLFSGAASLLTTTTAPTNGQLLIGSTGAAPVAATLTAGSGITITNAAGAITITLPTVTVALGGTGLTTGTSGGVLGYTAAGTLASSATLTTNNVVIGGGTGATPTATATLNIDSAGDVNNPVRLTVGGVANKRITQGALDSGGTGFRQLLVPNS